MVVGHVLRSLSNEWNSFVRKMRKLILDGRRRNAYVVTSVNFGNEKIQLLLQKYKCFELSHLLLLTLFGHNFSHINPSFIISNTNKQIILHIDSMEAVNDLFVLNGLCALKFKNEWKSNDDLKTINLRTCCGKLLLRKRNGDARRITIGYIEN